MEEMMRKKCEEYGIKLDVLTEHEKNLLRREIEARQRGAMICDSILDNPEIYLRSKDR